MQQANLYLPLSGERLFYRPSIFLRLYIVAVGVSRAMSFEGAGEPLSGWGTTWVQQAAPVAPPPPGPVPPNASHITATILSYSLWLPGSLRTALPPVPPDQTLYSLRVEIQTAAPESAELDSLAQPGSIVEVFSCAPLTSEPIGKQLRATLTLTGDTRGIRWWVSNIRMIP